MPSIPRLATGDRATWTPRSAPALGAWVALWAALAAGTARGQAEVRDPTQPLLTLDTGGHSAPVRALAFTAGGGQLLSGGMDKVVHAWDLGDEPGLGRTIRPPAWRGNRGQIYAMALAPPEAGDPGQQTLAVAGYGVQNPSGNIGLYRYPGRDGLTTGEVVAQLPAGTQADPEPAGHWDSVNCLAFDPRGRFLASGSFDRTVRVWDYRARRTLCVLRGHTDRVTGLAFSPDGTRLATAGADGLVRLWDTDPQRLGALDAEVRRAPNAAARQALGQDFQRGALLASAGPKADDAAPGNPQGAAVNALAFSPDGRWVVIGRENGRLIRYAAADLGGEFWMPTGRTQGAVEALAFSPDGARLVTSVVARRLRSLDERAHVACDVEVRAMPGGAVAGPTFVRSNLVYAAAFSPDGRWLAFAGGDDQAVCLRDLRDPNRPLVTLAGQGWSLWDVGFTRDSRSVGFARDRDDAPAPASRYWGFDLRGRRTAGYDRAELARARQTLDDGTAVRPLNPLALAVTDPGGRAHRLDLDRRTDGRWWSYTLIPPGPGHARPALAVGAEAGVIVFGYDPARQTYTRTRVFVGHTGPVYALAPSPDGRWLVTGSSDQTARLWALAGCDAVPAFGARFARRGGDGPWEAAAVEPRSYAEAMGLRPGDEIAEVYIAGPPALKPADALARLDAAAPDVRLEFRAARGGKPVLLGTTKRDSPALTLFPALDREWVLWTPRGFYDTSIAGDRRFLGWHRNGSKPGGAGVDTEAPTDFFTIDRFEKELRRPGVLDTLLETAEEAQALAPVPAPAREAAEVVRADPPPTVEIVAPARPAGRRLVVDAPGLPVRVRVRTETVGAARRRIGAVRFLVDSQVQRVEKPDRPEFEQAVELTLSPGVHRVNVAAVTDGDRERLDGFEVEYRAAVPPAPAPAPSHAPRMVVLAFGADRFSGGAPFPPIAFAAEDARDVARSLGDPAAQGFGKVVPTVLAGAGATGEGFRAAVGALDADRKSGALGPGDTVVVLVETHLVNLDGASLVAGTDFGPSAPASAAAPAVEVTEALGALAEYGCRVLLLLDGVHEAPPAPNGPAPKADAWVRGLTRRGVITFTASIQGPSQRLKARGHGAFAEALVRANDVRSQTRLLEGPARPLTLNAFREAVERGVQDLTGLRQVARCYVPGTVPRKLVIFDPAGRAVPRGFEARRQE